MPSYIFLSRSFSHSFIIFPLSSCLFSVLSLHVLFQREGAACVLFMCVVTEAVMYSCVVWKSHVLPPVFASFSISGCVKNWDITPSVRAASSPQQPINRFWLTTSLWNLRRRDPREFLRMGRSYLRLWISHNRCYICICLIANLKCLIRAWIGIEHYPKGIATDDLHLRLMLQIFLSASVHTLESIA